MAFREALLVEFDHEIAATCRMLAQIPAAAIDWRPHPHSRSFAELATHLTEVVSWSQVILSHEEFDLAEAAAMASSPGQHISLQDQFAAAASEARRQLDRSDGELTAIWILRQDGREVFALPRAAAFRTFVLAHVVHHRGQLSVYLRLCDIAVPPVYGPTATSARPKKA